MTNRNKTIDIRFCSPERRVKDVWGIAHWSQRDQSGEEESPSIAPVTAELVSWVADSDTEAEPRDLWTRTGPGEGGKILTLLSSSDTSGKVSRAKVTRD